MKNSEQPINPTPYINQDGTIQHDVYTGLTKLEYFAGLAMQGMLANPQFTERDPETVAEDSFCYAKALLGEFEIN